MKYEEIVVYQEKSHGMLAWVVWGLGAGFFFFQYVARITPSVMQPQLMQAFSINGYAFGGLSVVFYYAYMVAQIPAGLLVDRYGAKSLLIIMTLASGLGCLVFGRAHALYVAELGRFLMGFAGAFGFVSGIKLVAEWFAPNRFGMLTGATQGVGMLGAAIGGISVSVSVSSLGWRISMFVIASLFIVLSLLIFFVVQDVPAGRAADKKSRIRIPVWTSLVTVCKNPQTWLNGMYVGALFAPTAVFAELWGVSFLRSVYHLPRSTAALAIGCIFIGWAVGSPLIGWLSDYMGRRRPMMLYTSIFSALFLSIVLYMPHLSYSSLLIFLFLFGISNTGVSLGYAVAGEMCTRTLAGTSAAFANMASIVIGAAFQPLIGLLLDKLWVGKMSHGVRVYSASNFRWAMLVLIGFLLCSAVFSFFVRETYCQPVEHAG